MKQGCEIKKLGEVATYVNGYAFKPDHWTDDGVPIIRIQNLNNQDAVYNYCNMDIPKKFVVEYGDILISWSASLGVYEWLGERSYLNQHIFKVVFDKCNINKYFFKYAVSSKINEMLKNAHGATMKHIVKKDFDNTEIIYPSIAEQERIVGELDCLSGIIAAKRAQLRELDTLAQSIFYTMFGDPITNDKGWQTKKWEDLLTIVNGKNQKKVICENGKYPIYGSGGIMGWANDYLCPQNTVIIGRKGNINKPLFVKEKFWNVDTAFGLVANKEILIPYFLFFFCQMYNFEQHNKAVTIPSLTKSDLLNIQMPCPDIDLQTQFAEKIEHIEEQKQLIKASIAETEDLFNSRMSYYFN